MVRLVTSPIEREPRHVDVFVPALLKYISDEHIGDDVARLCRSYCEAVLISEKSSRPYTTKVLGKHSQTMRKLVALQKEKPAAWMWDDPFVELRYSAGLSLDPLGLLPVQYL